MYLQSGGGEGHYKDIVAVDPSNDDLVTMSTSFQDSTVSRLQARVHVDKKLAIKVGKEVILILFCHCMCMRCKSARVGESVPCDTVLQLV